MKKLVTSFILLLISSVLHAQWNQASIDENTYRNGWVGLGIDLPLYPLHIYSNVNQLLRLTSDTQGTWMDFENTNASVGNKVWSIGHAGASEKFGIFQRDGVNEYRFVINGSGNVGIGTSVPEHAKLQIKGGPTHRLLALNRPDNEVPALYLGNNGGIDAVIAANNSDLILGRDKSGAFSEYARIQNETGYMGLGIPNPLYPMHIKAEKNQLLKLTSGSQGTWMDFENTSASVGNKVWSIGHAGAAEKFGIYQRDGVNEYRLVIDGVGNVGISNSNPQYNLDVNGSINASEFLVNGVPVWSSTPDEFIIHGNGNVGIGTSVPEHAKLQIKGGPTHRLLALNRPDNEVPALYLGNNGDIDAVIASNNSDLILGRDKSGAFSEYARIQNETGYMGLGVSDPQYDLDVSGSINASEFLINGTPISAQNSLWSSTADGIVYQTGKIGIGTDKVGSHRLAVDGSIGARRIKVEMSDWPDFVFEESFALPTLTEVENHIRVKGHLKDIPSEEDVKNEGIYLGQMDAKLLQKIEELTLYMIQQNKLAKLQQTKIERLEKEMILLKNKLN